MQINKKRKTRVRRRSFLVAFVLGAWILGCGSPNEADGDRATQSYTVAGILTQLPAGPGKELMIRHVAIPQFVAASGDTVGMDVMTMGFPTDETIDLSTFAPGDSILFGFEVRWGGSPPLRLTFIEALPPGSKLDFSKLPPKP